MNAAAENELEHYYTALTASTLVLHTAQWSVTGQSFPAVANARLAMLAQEQERRCLSLADALDSLPVTAPAPSRAYATMWTRHYGAMTVSELVAATANLERTIGRGHPSVDVDIRFAALETEQERRSVEPSADRELPSELDIAADDELAQDLYPIFVALVDWSRKAGRTEHNASRASAAALRVLGVPVEIRSRLRDRYARGSQYLAQREES